MARAQSCRSIFLFPDARRIRSQFWMAYCGCWDVWRKRRIVDFELRRNKESKFGFFKKQTTDALVGTLHAKVAKNAKGLGLGTRRTALGANSHFAAVADFA
jgi:hypothetical protein